MLPYGVKDALRVLNYRVPPGTDPALCQVGNEALVRIYDVMGANVRSEDAGHVLKAAQIMRHEICGALPTATVVKHEGLETLAERLRDAREAELARVKAGARA